MPSLWHLQPHLSVLGTFYFVYVIFWYLCSNLFSAHNIVDLLGINTFLLYQSKFEIVNFKIPSTDLTYFIKFYKNSHRQKFWDFCDASKLYSIEKKATSFYFHLKRSDQLIVSNWRIGHSKLTHKIFKKGTTTWVHILWLFLNI